MKHHTDDEHCDVCGGWLGYLGQLGSWEHWECRNCGQKHAFREEPAPAPTNTVFGFDHCGTCGATPLEPPCGHEVNEEDPDIYGDALRRH